MKDVDVVLPHAAQLVIPRRPARSRGTPRNLSSSAVGAELASARPPLHIDWIRSLAQPYLRGYLPLAEQKKSLRGYWFLHPRSAPPASATASRPALGFFVGYLTDSQEFAYLKPAPPECLVFTFIAPVGKGLHRRLVGDSEGLLRKTAAYIRWLTHRPPRFAFFESEPVVLVRHFSMRDWPPEKYEHFSRNFYIETLAWLVRSALVRRLLAETLAPTTRAGLRA